MSDIITAKDLSLWYGNHQALTDISVGIPEKSITALIGPSGCGKSTFLKTLNRMNDLIPGVRITGDVRYRDMEVYAPSTDVTALRRQNKHFSSSDISPQLSGEPCSVLWKTPIRPAAFVCFV